MTMLAAFLPAPTCLAAASLADALARNISGYLDGNPLYLMPVLPTLGVLAPTVFYFPRQAFRDFSFPNIPLCSLFANTIDEFPPQFGQN